MIDIPVITVPEVLGALQIYCAVHLLLYTIRTTVHILDKVFIRNHLQRIAFMHGYNKRNGVGHQDTTLACYEGGCVNV